MIKNIINNKVYIGSSKDIISRWNQHKNLLRKNKHYNPYLQHVYNLYSENNLNFEIIETCSDDILLQREQYWMDYFQSYNKENGYNIEPTANRTIHSKESILKASMSKKGKYVGEKCGTAKLKDIDVIEIIDLLLYTNLNFSEIGKMFYVNKNTISKIYKKQNWTHLTKNIDFPDKTRRGERVAQSKITESLATEIIQRLVNGELCSEIASDYNISRRSVNDIRLKNTWKHLTNNIIFPNRSSKRGESNNKSKLTEKDVINIKNKLKNGETYYSLAEKYNVSPTSIMNINKNKTWKHV